MSDRHPLAPEDLATRAQWQRWEMDALGVPRPTPLRRASDRDAQRQRAALERAREAILTQAQEAGQAKGYAIGLRQGREAGQAQGFEAGHREGLESGRQAGRVEGQAEGRAQAYAEKRDALAHQAQQLDALLQACGEALHQLEAEVGQALIGLAIRIAERVLSQTLQEDPGVITALVTELLASSPEQTTPIALRLHPDDLTLAQDALAARPESRRYRLVPDAHLQRGGCVVETDQGSIDATLQTRWQRVLTTLGHPTDPDAP